MKVACFVAYAAALGLSGAAVAQETTVSNPRDLAPNFDTETLGPILTELGTVWQRREAPNGQPYIAMSVGGELTLNIVPAACKGRDYTDCIGMNTVALFAGAGLNYQTVMAFNQKYWFSTAGVAEDGSSAYLSRYEISDYGIPRGNIAASVINLVALAERFRAELDSAAKTVSQQGYAGDLSARLLNGREMTTIGVNHPLEMMQGHDVAFEESAALVDLLLADENAPRNKIENAVGR